MLIVDSSCEQPHPMLDADSCKDSNHMLNADSRKGSNHILHAHSRRDSNLMLGATSLGTKPHLRFRSLLQEIESLVGADSSGDYAMYSWRNSINFAPARYIWS